MPIRFRCAYCNQLMGISTRKAGTVVRCPKCAGEIIVPMPEGMQPPEERAEQGAGPQAFEDQNFEQVFSPPANGSAGAPPSGPLPMGALSSAELTMAGAPEGPKRPGLFLPLPMLIISLVVIVLLFILVFVLGLIIGRQTAVNPEVKATTIEPPRGQQNQPRMKLSAAEPQPQKERGVATEETRNEHGRNAES